MLSVTIVITLVISVSVIPQETLLKLKEQLTRMFPSPGQGPSDSKRKKRPVLCATGSAMPLVMHTLESEGGRDKERTVLERVVYITDFVMTGVITKLSTYK